MDVKQDIFLQPQPSTTFVLSSDNTSILCDPSIDALWPFIADDSRPVFITSTENDIILAANNSACSGYSGRPFNGRSISQYIRGYETVNEETTLVYYNREWRVFNKKPFLFEGSYYNKISLDPCPGLPDNAQIETAKNMIAVMLHRFRSPMTGMRGYLDLLMGESNVEKQARHLSILNNGMEQLNEMLNELESLHFNEPHPDTQWLIPRAVAREMISFFDNEIRNKIQIIQKGKDRPVQGHRRKLIKILELLVSNAIEHSSNDHEKIFVEIESSGKIIVTNYGEPISNFMEERMFQPFMTNKAQNMGIGLSHAHILARSMGALVLLTRNNKDDGISFTLLFPPTTS